MKVIAVIFMCLAPFFGFSQLKKLEVKAYPDWERIAGSRISPDGKYVLYTYGSDQGGLNLVICAFDLSWKKEIRKCYYGEFTPDSKTLIYQKDDTIGLIRLEDKQTMLIPSVASFKLGPGHIAWTTKDAPADLQVMPFGGGKKITLKQTADYVFNPDGHILILGSEHQEWLADSATGDKKLILSEKPDQVTPSADGKLIALAQRQAISLYDTRTGNTRRLDSFSFPLLVRYRLSGQSPVFSHDGRHLLVWLKPPSISKKELTGAASVDVWNYKDTLLKSREMNSLPLDTSRTLMAAYDLKERTISMVEKNNQEHLIGDASTISGEFVLVQKVPGDVREQGWNPRGRAAIYLVNLQNGKETLVTGDVRGSIENSFCLDPGQQYVVYYDNAKTDYRSYRIKDGSTHVLSPAGFGADKLPFSLAAWLNDGTLLVCDRFDLWQLDPSGKQPAVNISGGYGRKHHVAFRLADADPDATAYNHPVKRTNDTLLLSAFDLTTKDNGYYQLLPGSKPRQCTMGPYVYQYDFEISYDIITQRPQKAKDANAWVVQRRDGKSSPNFFLTNDFKTFRPLSDVHPERQYQWFSKELVSWKLPDGKTAQGLLYKPGDFDPRKRYPLIVHVYEQKSNLLHNFLEPKPSEGSINIPYYAANGYLVFEPDITYTPGRTGRNAFDAVVSGVNYLLRRPYIDGRHVGMQGISYGGFETNYLVSHTRLFAAAAESAGTADDISAYNAIVGDGISEQGYYESGQGRMGASLWQDPAAYLRNSPVLRADQVTTPMLICHNLKDPVVPWEQAVEWYTSLRRLHKKVWLLQYDGETHGLAEEINQLDYDKRLSQFFGYYLKGEPPHVWMTQGIPFRDKKINDGLEADKTGRTP